jgi:hypothetical protein
VVLPTFLTQTNYGFPPLVFISHAHKWFHEVDNFDSSKRNELPFAMHYFLWWIHHLRFPYTKKLFKIIFMMLDVIKKSLLKSWNLFQEN